MPSSFCPLPHPHPHSASSHFSGRLSAGRHGKVLTWMGPPGSFFTRSSFYRNKHYDYPGPLSLNFSVFLSQRRPKPWPHIRKPAHLMEARTSSSRQTAVLGSIDNREAPRGHLWIALPGTRGPLFNWHPRKNTVTRLSLPPHRPPAARNSYWGFMNLRGETLLYPAGYRSLITSVRNQKLSSLKAGYPWPSLCKQEKNEMRHWLEWL